MLDVVIGITGSERTIARLTRLATQSPKTADRTLYQWAQESRAVLKSTPYPPKRAGQKYVRTGRFANSWRAERAGLGKARISNSARSPKTGRLYPVFVAGDGAGKGQAWMHKGRWRKARDVVDSRIPRLRRALARDIAKQ